ncbi:tetratricopeptide repeat protein [Ancylobacter radicis]|uniref:SEL1-like repeat protein n=1 Tax=Ancylobacter radicis TaxID=2836179 RepID=A0ABS5R4X1_9HYPH|nr:tetratricopeptide repeat protein [Ancylobacter radicis]MBS9476694.1 SEL1-like repeat protein [Ancylobacter radicis]
MSEAARLAGQPLDQWLKDQLLASNAGAMQTAGAPGGTVEDLQRRVQELSGVIDRLVSAAPAGVTPSAAPSMTPSLGLAESGRSQSRDAERRFSEPVRASEPPRMAEPAYRTDAYAAAGMARSPSPVVPAAPASSESRLDAALRQINERLDSINTPRQRPASAPSASAATTATAAASPANHYFDRRVNEIVRTAETLGRAGQPLAGRFMESAPGPDAIEAAVAEIAARQSELDAPRERRIPSPPSVPVSPTVPPLGSTGAPPASRSLLINEQIGALQRDLGEMRESIAALAPRRAVDELQRTVARLADRAERAQVGDDELRATLGSMREMIGALKLPEHPAVLMGRIETLERKIDIVNAKSVDGAAIARLQAQANEIRDLLGRALSTDALRLLAEQVAMLAAKVSQMPAVDEAMIRSVVGNLERRIDHLADTIGNQPAPTIPLGDIFSRLDSIQNGLASVRRDVPAGVEPLIRGLADRIERIERPIDIPDHGPRFDALSRQVAAIAEKLDAAGDPAAKIGGQLATIERAVNDLFIQMEETRATILANAGHRPRAGAASGSALLKREIAAIEANRATAAAPAAPPAMAPPAPERTAPENVAQPAAPVSQATEPQPSVAPPPASIPKPFEPQLMRAALEELSRSPEVVAAFAAPEPAPAPAQMAPAYVAPAAVPASPAVPGPAFEPDEGALIGALGDDYLYENTTPPRAARAPARPLAPAAENDDDAALLAGAPSRTQFIAQARRATQPASVVLPEMHSRIGDRQQRAKPVSPGRRWLARIRAMLLIGMCGSAMAYGSWHLLTTMREAQLRAKAPAAAGIPPRNVARPAAPTAAPGSLPSPDDITGSVGAPRSAPALPAAPPALPEPAPDLVPDTPPGPSSLSAPTDLPGAIGSQGLRSAALAGDPVAAYEIGHRFMDGVGVAASAARAAEWFEFAAANGSVPAAYRLGAIYEKGLDGVTRDVARARVLYEQAAKAGNVRAMHNLGVLLAAGIDGQPDYRTAAQWFARAAERGVRDSQYNLAVLYARGFGVAVDLGQAWRWFSLAAAAGDGEAGVKRDEIAAKLDAKALATARAAIAKWTPIVVDAKANGSDWNTDGSVPKKTASR